VPTEATMTTDHTTIPGLSRSFITARAWLGRFPLSIIQLAMRIGVGSVFFKAGLLKFNSWEFAVKLFEDEYKVPLLSPVVAARITMFNELTWPVLLFLGLATRVATVPILAMIAVIQLFVYPQAWTDHLLWGSVLVFLLTHGGGTLSLDHLIERRFATREPKARRPPTRA
jgi:putative oxidoreductase